MRTWSKKVLEEVALIKGGYAFDSKRFLQNGKFQVIKMSNLYEGKLNLERGKSFIDELTEKEKDFLIQPEDILITLTGTVGKRDYGYTFQITNEKNLLLNQRVSLLRGKDINKRFLYYYLKTDNFLDRFFFSSRGGTGNQANVSTVDLGKIKILLPPLIEQQKIAQILSTWDKAIEQQNTLIEKLETRKRGLMQQIFNKKIRFKDENGNNYPDWTINSFGQIYELLSTNSLTRDNLNYIEGDIKNIHYGDIHTKFNSLFDINKEQVPYINKGIILSKALENNFCKNRDLIIADASEDYADIGKSIEIINLGEEKVIAGLHTILARPKNNNSLTIGFGGYLMQSEPVKLQIKRIAQGTKILGLSPNRLSLIKISLPSFHEQRRIVDILSQADTEIDLAKKKLSTYQQQKKALMQQLLTGKTRVRIDS